MTTKWQVESLFVFVSDFFSVVDRWPVVFKIKFWAVVQIVAFETIGNYFLLAFWCVD